MIRPALQNTGCAWAFLIAEKPSLAISRCLTRGGCGNKEIKAAVTCAVTRGAVGRI